MDDKNEDDDNQVSAVKTEWPRVGDAKKESHTVIILESLYWDQLKYKRYRHRLCFCNTDESNMFLPWVLISYISAQLKPG